MQIYHIARNGNKILELTSQEVFDALKVGTVLPSDHYWTQGMPAWELVSKRTSWVDMPIVTPPVAPVSQTAASKPAMNIKGRVLDYNIATSYGLISGDDGIRYNFAGAEWKTSGVMPVNGVRVEFVSSGSSAVAIYAVAAVAAGARPYVSIGTSVIDGYYRSSDDNSIGGVCAGLAHKWGRNPELVRLFFLLLCPLATFFYFLFWLSWSERKTLTREDVRSRSVAAAESAKASKKRMKIILIIAAAIFFFVMLSAVVASKR